jgi:hypothetical protein
MLSRPSFAALNAIRVRLQVGIEKLQPQFLKSLTRLQAVKTDL